MHVLWAYPTYPDRQRPSGLNALTKSGSASHVRVLMQKCPSLRRLGGATCHFIRGTWCGPMWAHVLHVPPCFPPTYRLSLALATSVRLIAAGWGERGLQSTLCRASLPCQPAPCLPQSTWQRAGMGGHGSSLPFPSGLMGAGISGRDE